MKTLRSILVLALGAMLIVGCKNSGEKTLTSATGSIYECLVVIDDKALTQEQLDLIASKKLVNEASAYSEPITNTYELVKAIMEADMPCMPQMEPYFNLTHVSVAMFDELFKPTRNILYVDINPERYTQLKVKVSTNNWSTPQAMCRIQAASQEEFVNYWLENGEGIRDWFVNQELLRQAKFYRGGSNKEACKKLEKYRYNILIPSDYVLVKDTVVLVESGKSIVESKGEEVHVVWCCNNKGSMRRDVLVYSYPYIDTKAFTKEELNARRDAVLSQLVTGSVDGSFMGTEYKVMPPQMRTILVQDSAQAYEIKGLWKILNGEAMGGPYVSHTRLDHVNGRVVTAESFIYAAGQKKRNALRQAEAVLYTLQLPEDK
jgi:hypothetical protein